jgi:C4-dicarboxylate-specific signal transduction histidine kinase
MEYIAAVQDVTVRRLAEDAFDKARAQLTHVSRMMSLGVLTASIAHELNQPLSGIITNANTCLRMLGADPPDVDGARETALRTIRDGNRASEVIVRLRALFTKKESTTELVDLNEATRELIALSSSNLQRNRVVLRQELADDLPAVVGDRVQLQQVILNLLLNACDAMSDIDDRSRQLTISTAEVTATRCVWSCGMRVSVSTQGLRTSCSKRSTRQKRAGWGSGSPSAVPSSKSIKVAFGPPRTMGQVPPSRFPFRAFQRTCWSRHR